MSKYEQGRYSVEESASGWYIRDGLTGYRMLDMAVATMLNDNIHNPSTAKIDALLEAVRAILNRSILYQQRNEVVVEFDDMEYLRNAYLKIVPPKTTEQLLQDRLDAADALWERFGGEAVTSRGVEVINAYSNAKKAHEASKP